MQMLHYAIKHAQICINVLEHCTKPGSKFLFRFVDILELKVFTEGILDIFLHYSINQKILSTVRKTLFAML